MYDVVKRILDVILAVVGIMLTVLPMMLIALWVRLDSKGPVLYRARRLGRDREVFHQLKFRTMIADAPILKNPDGSTMSADEDPRVTRAGRILRKLSLDELPQFFNVLKGEMSFVGPRPDPEYVVELYRPQDFERLTVLPGITGWAIVHGRNDIPWERRRDYDLEYVKIRTIKLDCTVILRTLLLVVQRRGIHAKG
jgi:lipopolysaccharide/colanic/teichoic acid biosynthesis glycosyltransferase